MTTERPLQRKTNKEKENKRKETEKRNGDAFEGEKVIESGQTTNCEGQGA